MKVSGSIALVTGANRGLGLSFAKMLVEMGAAKAGAIEAAREQFCAWRAPSRLSWRRTAAARSSTCCLLQAG